MIKKTQKPKELNLLQRYAYALTRTERTTLFMAIGVRSENTMYKYLREPKLLTPPQRDVLASGLGKILKITINGSDLYKPITQG